MVVYLLCFDLSEPINKQHEQMEYWLNFINSALPLPNRHYQYDDTVKWVILPVGLKLDLQKSPGLQTHNIKAWANQFSHLPIFPQLFDVSLTKSDKSAVDLLKVIQQQCDQIFSTHTTLIPTSYHEILRDLKSLPSHPAIHQDEIFSKYSHGLTSEGFIVALQYLHAIGRIVVLKSGLVFPDSRVATQTAAKFISPEDVRINALVQDNVQILGKKQVGYLLDVGNCNKRFVFFCKIIM
jgi:hypothetical protein